MWSYKKTLDFMYEQLPMYQRLGAPAFKKDLDNILALCNHLGNPQNKLKCIHVAGTNGKGTVTHLIAAGLIANGYKTGIYTSPHYIDFRERIKIGNEYIDKLYVRKFINENIKFINEIKPSFFEITVAMAFDYFSKNNVDYAVIEVGLGGRLDSTNIITPILSVITNISLDHTSMLGNTLEEIAYEKAGIIKKDVPVIIGEKQIETTTVFKKKANTVNAKLYFAEELGSIKYREAEPSSLKCEVNSSFSSNFNFEIDIVGSFQKKNINTALQSLLFLKNHTTININTLRLKEHLPNFRKNVGYMGRWQTINEKPLAIVDSAHNESGILNAIDMINQLKKDNIHFVFGMVNDKDATKILNLLPKNWKYYFAKANIPRGLNTSELIEKAKCLNIKGKAYTSVKKAFSSAKLSAKENDLVFIGGSIFVVAEVL